MTREETTKILAVLQAAYPMFYRNQTRQQMQDTVLLWEDVFSDKDYNLVKAAVKALITTRTETFPPNVGSVIDMIQKITVPELSPLDAWGYVSRALRNGIYGAEEEWAKLPECVRKAITPEQIREWASDNEYKESVASSNFMKSYIQSRKTARELEMMPDEIRIAAEEALRRLTERPVPEQKFNTGRMVESESAVESINNNFRERLLACRAEVV